jgi:dipeptidyl aminopeptidase/acylaminoacyl peptidase
MKRPSLFMLFSLCLCVSVVQAAERLPYTPAQLAFVRRIDSCRLSPDGKTVAFVSDATGSPELWIIPAAGGWPTQLTELKEAVGDVHWSPDGKWLVFTTDYGGNERDDIYRVPADGGKVEKLTDTPDIGEQEPRFSPDGKRLAFIADPASDFKTDLFVMDLVERKPKQLTREAVNVTSPRWSRDGTLIAATRSGDGEHGELLLVDPATGATSVIEPPVKKGIAWPAAFAPDGEALLLMARNADGFNQLAVLKLAKREEGKPPRGAGTITFLGPGKWDVSEARWTKEGIYFLRNEGGATSLNFLAYPPGEKEDTFRVLLPAAGRLHGLSLDRDGKTCALLREDVTHPADVFVAATSDVKAGKQITFSLLGGVKAEALSPGKMEAYESFDKTKIHALVVRPRVERLGSPPPAVVFVHGGPDSQKALGFDPFIQLLAEQGIAVIAPNYRGSTGYGKKFEDLNNKDWGGGDLKDLVAAVRHFGAQGVIDPKRVGITGGSYGGYMTLMALSRTPEVWAAGVERYGMPDLVMDFMLTRKGMRDWYETEMGNPKTDGALFRERSPLAYLGDIKAPLLIFQGANDANVPRAESDLLAAVLKEQKKEYEYIVYSDEGHGFQRRKNLLDYYRRTSAFFVRHLKQKQ